MNTKTIVGVIIAIVIIGGGMWYFSSKSPSTSDTDTTSNTSSTTNSIAVGEPNPSSPDLATLLASGGNYQCTVDINMPNMTAKGNIFVAGKDVRASFDSTVMNRAITTNMLQTGGYVYTWNSLVTQGAKAPIVQNTNPLAFTGQTSYAMSDNFKYNCQAWSPDTAKFVVPTNITFVTAPTAPKQ